MSEQAFINRINGFIGALNPNCASKTLIQLETMEVHNEISCINIVNKFRCVCYKLIKTQLIKNLGRVINLEFWSEEQINIAEEILKLDVKLSRILGEMRNFHKGLNEKNIQEKLHASNNIDLMREISGSNGSYISDLRRSISFQKENRNKV